MAKKKAPKSYLDHRRPPLMEALKLEGGTLMEATESLKRKGYYTPPPRPWQLGFNDRGLGRGDYAVLDKFGDLVVTVENRETAVFIIEAANSKDK
jgi:hypothetical protein